MRGKTMKKVTPKNTIKNQKTKEPTKEEATPKDPVTKVGFADIINDLTTNQEHIQNMLVFVMGKETKTGRKIPNQVKFYIGCKCDACSYQMLRMIKQWEQAVMFGGLTGIQYTSMHQQFKDKTEPKSYIG